MNRDLALYLGILGLLLTSLSILRTHLLTWVEKACSWFAALAWTSQYQLQIQKLMKAAGQSTSDIMVYQKKTLAMFGMFTLGLVYLSLWSGTWTFMFMAMLFPLARYQKVKRRHVTRNREISRTFPYFLDLFILCLESGLDNTRAIKEICQSEPGNPLYQELGWAIQSTEMGTSISRALLDAGDRTQNQELYFLGHSIAQSNELGTSLANILRMQSSTLREKIFQHAQEQAQKAPVKILFPLIFCIFPVVFIVLFVPLALSALAL